MKIAQKNIIPVLPFLMAILGFFSPSTSATSQNHLNQFITLDTIIFLQNEKNTRSMACSSWGDEVILTNFHCNSSSDTIAFHIINFNNYGLETVKIHIPYIRKTMKKLMNCSFKECLAYNGNTIALMRSLGYDGGENILIFRKNNGENTYFYHKTIRTKTDARRIDFIDTSTVLLSEINYRTGASFHTVDINTGKITNSIYPYHNHKIISGFTSKQYDIKDNLLLYANRLEYSFLTFDQNLQQLDSTYQKIEDWGKLPDKAIKTIEQKWGDDFNAAEINHYLTQYYTKIHQLNRVYVINKNKLLLSYTPKDTENDISRPIIDIWEKNDFGWIRSKHDIVDDLGFNRSDSIIKTNSFFLEMLSNPQIFVFNNKIVTVSDEGTPIYPIGMTPRDYYAKSNDYLAENEQIIEIRIFSHNF